MCDSVGCCEEIPLYFVCALCLPLPCIPTTFWSLWNLFYHLCLIYQLLLLHANYCLIFLWSHAVLKDVPFPPAHAPIIGGWLSLNTWISMNDTCISDRRKVTELWKLLFVNCFDVIFIINKKHAMANVKKKFYHIKQLKQAIEVDRTHVAYIQSNYIHLTYTQCPRMDTCD